MPMPMPMPVPYPPLPPLSTSFSSSPPSPHIATCPPSPMPPVPLALPQPQRSSLAPPAPLPRYGETRCYWALLAPQYGPKLELKFVYLDPALASHLGPQHPALLSRGLIELIHPGEREQARVDLASSIGNDDLQGSVTRMRFARLSRIRSILGCPPQDLKIPPELNAVAEDDEYIIIDLVLNWVADGLLLAFFHVIKDRDPVANNDPARRLEEWSNFCGAPTFSDEAIATLQQCISSSVSPPARTRAPPRRVFQLHTTLTSPTHPISLLFTWPPARPPDAPVQVDGLYDAEEYAEIMRGVDMDPSRLATKPGEVKTNCTTRFGAEHSIRTEGVYRHIASVFIPYGSLVFACFQTTKCYELPMTSSTNEAWATSAAAAAAAAAATTSVSAPTLPPPPSIPPQPSLPSIQAAARDWRSAADGYDTAYVSSAYPDYGHHGGFSAHHPHDAAVAAAGVGAGFHARIPGASETTPTPPRVGGGSTRPLVRPPGDVEKCRGCGTRESPEWRKGENGVKDLCNACGLKLARAVAKREGRQKPRKKDKL